MVDRLRTLLSRHLLIANVGTSCAQIGTADIIQQFINGDIERDGRMAAIGLVTAPTLHCFYRILDTRKFNGTRNSKVFKKLAWDTTFIPFFSCMFITVGAIYEGKTFGAALAEYRRKMWHIWKVDFTLWPPAQFINFYFLPPAFRIVYVNLVSLLYNCIMSYIKNNELHHTTV